MATIKSYTDLSQSKALAKILPLESADMFHFIHEVDTVGFGYKREAAEFYSKTEFEYLPCWSLAALLKLIPNFNMFKRTIECKIETTNHSIDKACDLVDAAFEMVCWLKENNEL